MPQSSTPKLQDNDLPPQVKCPTCGTLVTWEEKSLHRPFCSARCKDGDFIDWANESHRIAGSNEYDDLLSDTLNPEAHH